MAVAKGNKRIMITVTEGQYKELEKIRDDIFKKRGWRIAISKIAEAAMQTGIQTKQVQEMAVIF